jgi:5-phospho-D-xylono-1,4-lactonase
VIVAVGEQRDIIRTALGDITADMLGRTNYHEHLFQVSPLLHGDDLDDETLSGEEAQLLRESGFDTMVNATPIGLSRRPEAVARISEKTGLGVVMTTGTHREAHYAQDHWLRRSNVDVLSDMFIRDLTEAMPVDDTADSQQSASRHSGEPIRAGVLKAGIDYWSISPFEHRTLEAVARAHAHTGAPVMIHVEFCTATHEVLTLLESFGVSPHRVCLAHADRTIDPDLHVSLIERGTFLGYDGMARWKNHSDHALIDLTASVMEKAGPSQILLGGDVARRSRYVAYGGMPGLGYLGQAYIPRLTQRVGSEAVDAMVGKNAARWLTWQQSRDSLSH